MSLAAQAVRPLCPYCGRPVRGGVELRDACADVEDLLQVARRRADAGKLEDLELLVITNTDAMDSLRHLQAELGGAHLLCLPRVQ